MKFAFEEKIIVCSVNVTEFASYEITRQKSESISSLTKASNAKLPWDCEKKRVFHVHCERISIEPINTVNSFLMNNTVGFDAIPFSRLNYIENIKIIE